MPRSVTSTSGRLARWLLLATAIAPLAYVPLVTSPAVVSSAVAFRVLVAGAVLATALPLATGSLTGQATRRDWLGALMVVFVAVASAAALASPATSKGLYGTLHRMWGVVAWVHLLAFYFLLRLWFGGKDWNRFLWLAVATSTIYAAALLVGEVSGWFDLMIVRPNAPDSVLVFGHEGPASAYLMVGLFLLGLVFARTRVRVARTGLVVAGALHLTGMFLLDIRAPLFGAAVGGVTLLLGSGIRRWGSRAVLRTLIGAAVVTTAAVATQDLLAGSSLIDSLSESKLLESSRETRWLGWITAVEGIQARPLLGFGPESFASVFERFFDPSWYGLSLGDTTQTFSGGRILDRPHNAFLGAFVETGLVGGILYLGIGILFAVRALRSARSSDPEIAWQGWILLGLGAAMTVYLFFWFEDHGALVLFVAALALASHIRDQEEARGGAGVDASGGRLAESRGRTIVRTGGAVLLVAGAMASFHLQVGVIQGTRAAHLGDTASVATERVRHYERAFEVTPPGIHQDLAVRYTAQLIRSRNSFRRREMHPEVERILDRAVQIGISAMRTAIRRDPENPDMRFKLAGLHYAVAYPFYRDGRHVERAIRNTEAAISIAPDRLHYRHELARILLREGRARAAARVTSGALQRYDGLPRTHELRSRALRGFGQFTEADRAAARADSLRNLVQDRTLGNPRPDGSNR